MLRVVGPAIVVLAAAVVAQQQTEQPRFRSAVNVIQVDVSVLDRSRMPIRGLVSDDFVLFEDGSPQKITSFTEVDLPAPTVPVTAWMRDVAPDVRGNDEDASRLLVLVLDDAQVKVELRMPARVKEIARRIVDELGPNDLAAVVFTRNNSGAQDFTRDRARLLRAIDSFTPALATSPLPPPPALQGTGMRPAPVADPYSRRSTLGTLREVSRYLAAAQQRRKALIYISPGIPVDFTSFQGDSTFLLETQDALRYAHRANVTIYALDPSGLGGAADEDLADERTDISKLRREFLRSLAADTGGLVVLDREDFSPSVTQIFRETSSYYLLGYESSNAKTDGRFRAIDVRVDRPGVTVRARRGYFSPRSSSPSRSDAAAAPLQAALAGLLPKTDLAVRVTAAPFATSRREAAVAVTVWIRRAPQPGHSSRDERIDVVASIYDTRGELKATSRESIRSAALGSTDGTVHEVVTRIDAKPGRYSLRIGAQTATTNKSGSVFYDLDVPDYSREPLSLSGLVLSTATASKTMSAGLGSLLPVIPTTRREFGTAENVTAFFRVYNGGTAALRPTDVTVRVTNSVGGAAFERTLTISAEQLATTRGANVLLPLPLAGLAAGPYLLTVEAAHAGQNAVRRYVRFDVK